MEENEFLVNEVFLDTVFVEGKYTMTDVVDKLLAKGEARGEARGKAEGKTEGIILAMKALGKSMTEVIEVFSDLMKISKEEAESKVKGLWDTV